MSDSTYTTITVTKDTLSDFNESKEEYYGEIGDEVSNERFIKDMMFEVNNGC